MLCHENLENCQQHLGNGRNLLAGLVDFLWAVSSGN
jgi:hypothetical protein